MPPTDRQQVNTRLHTDTLTRLRREADRRQVSVTKLIQTACDTWLDLHSTDPPWLR